MLAEYLSYKETGYFSKLMVDYLDRKPSLDEFIEYDNSLEAYGRIISERNKIPLDRELLVERLKVQNSELKLSLSSSHNIELLNKENTFTITTGHQLSFFTGPLYYIYKTVSVIKLAQELTDKFPDNSFVPVFWMATEDHDFEEINHFRYKEELFSWNSAEKGAVGRMKLKNMNSVFSELKDKIGGGKRAEYLLKLFSRSYLEHGNLAQATRYLVNELFGEYGLVVIDGDDRGLKKSMIPAFKKELLDFSSDRNIEATNTQIISKGYKVQVHQRQINLFYLRNNLRDRIVLEGDKYLVLNSDIEFSKNEILVELEKYPERFSPNAILRPLYEEHVLPNLAYVGGGGELAYWFQLKNNFTDFGVSFPILVLRNSVLLINGKHQRRINNLDLSISDIFNKIDVIIRNKVIANSTCDIDISENIDVVNKMFYSLLKKYEGDKTQESIIKAQYKKQLSGLYYLEKKLLKTEKRKQNDLVSKLEKIKDQLFPNNGLQERNLNFAEMYMEFGEELIPSIFDNISVMNNEFLVLR
ncbi:MAG: bacillithiol biosynthesis cysteine-adding enzyme BshC [Flavobacteriales bacterium]|nr:bacillithiol biosynthesis cysteine-adding enzyme BshC [Flavobacteriales bacterium]